MLLAAVAVLVFACTGDKPAAKKKAPANRTPDAAVRKPLPAKTTGAGFQLPAPTTSAIDRGVSIVDSGKGKPIDLALGFKQGDKQTLELLMTARVGGSEGRAAMTYATEVESTGNEGAVLRLTFRDVTVSSKPDKVRSAAMKEMAAKLDGRSIRARITPDGRATVVATDKDLEQLLGRLHIDPAQLFANMYPRFPAKKLGIGAKWLSQVKNEHDGVVETTDLTYELTGAEASPRGQLITVDAVGKVTVTGPKARGRGALHGQVVLIPSRGLITKATLRHDVRIKAADQSVSMSMLVDLVEKSGS